MSESDTSFDQIMRQWIEQAGQFGANLQKLFTPVAAQSSDTVNGQTAKFEELAAAWGKALAELARLQNQVVKNWLDGQPEAALGRLDAQTFGQLNRLARANWDEQMRLFTEKPLEIISRAARADPERTAQLVQSMLAEYAADLQALDPQEFAIDLKPLAEAWAKVISGTADPDSSKMIERFVESMTVKAKYGLEYYADPAATPVGRTARELVKRFGKIELYRYRPLPDSKPSGAAPVLIVYSIINKPYILDLIPGYSFIEHLLEQGLDVYLVEWGQTEPGDRDTSLDSYIEPGLADCVEAICRQTGSRRVSLFGHCIGGNLALMYAALHPARCERLVALTTPLTAAAGGVVALWTDRNVFPVDDIIDLYGHMPAKLIRYTFIALKPYYEVLKWKMFMQNLANDQVMALFGPVDRWANENVDIPGEVFRKFVHEVFHEDRFKNNQTRINGKIVDLRAIDCPVLNLAAKRDWIVPLDSCQHLDELVSSSQKSFVPIEGAHVSIMIDPRLRPLWNTISDFLKG